MRHDPNCAVVRRGDLQAWCDCGADARVAAEVGAYRERVLAALRADASQCDCYAFEDIECACGARDGWKSVPLWRAVEIVEGVK